MKRIGHILYGAFLLLVAVIGGATVVCVFGALLFLISFIDFCNREWRLYKSETAGQSDRIH
jgi:hypothetical protein